MAKIGIIFQLNKFFSKKNEFFFVNPTQCYMRSVGLIRLSAVGTFPGVLFSTQFGHYTLIMYL